MPGAEDIDEKKVKTKGKSRGISKKKDAAPESKAKKSKKSKKLNRGQGGGESDEAYNKKMQKKAI